MEKAYKFSKNERNVKCLCERCNDTGLVLVTTKTDESISIYGEDFPPVEYAVPCPHCKGGYEVKVNAYKTRANIPQAFYDKRLDSFDWNIYQDSKGNSIDLSQQKAFIDNFIENFNEWEKQGLGLYIWSHMKGSGKTYLASCICNELISRYPMGTKFVSANELIDIAKSGDKEANNLYDKDPIELLCNCKLLVIDDLGQKTSGINWINDILFRIADSRLQKRLVTIVTSNIKLTDLEIDDRIVDRLYKLCQMIPLPDYPVRQKETNEERTLFLKRMGLTARKEAV